jgi:hypothetical protein
MTWRAASIALPFALSLAINLIGAVMAASWWSIPAALIGWYLADLVSGTVHMVMDYRPCPPGRGLATIYSYAGSRESDDYRALLAETMAKLSPLDRLVYDFKNHHPRPDALGRRPLWRQIGSSVALGALPVSLLLNLAWILFGLPGWVMAGGLTLLLGGAFAQYFHGSLHRADNPALIRILRRLGLLMTPEAHRLHHDTLQRDFSTNCGWSNPLLNKLFRAGRRRGHFADSGLEPHS